MTTQITTTNPVRSDLDDTGSRIAHAAPSRRWAVAGIAAAVTGIASSTASSLVSAVYDRDLLGRPEAIADELAGQTTAMLVFHVATVASALLMVVFAAGLFRRLRAELGPDHLAPLLAFAGLVGTAVVLVVGSSLNTEFIFGVQEESLVNPANAAMYNHIVGTVAWCWVLIGVSALALWSAHRSGAVTRWMGGTSLVLGGLTVVVGIAPVQYMASLTGQLWLLAIALGFVFGDRVYRRG